MGSTRGIAGSTRPEVEGIFLCSESEVDWFIGMNNTGGPVDVWAVDGVDEQNLVESPNGYRYLPAPIPFDQLALLEHTVPPRSLDESGAPSTAYQSSITLELDDGTILRDDEAHAWIRRNAEANEQP
ncbi:MAG TPA: hypothetical protein VE441_08475 [Mycobacterium sp.]|jgi:hypothetical protein|nr:hypothetical protein [Mycobacterium sp.]